MGVSAISGIGDAYAQNFRELERYQSAIAGRGLANPIGQIWCGSMMLEHLGHLEAGAAVFRAIEKVLEAGPKNAPFTPDMGGTANTSDLGRAIAEAVRAG